MCFTFPLEAQAQPNGAEVGCSGKENMEQFNIFDFTRKELRIDKPIRLIELFAGYGSQAMALENLGVDFDHYLAVEFDKYAIASYNAVHGTEFPVMDICDLKGSDLNIEETDKYCYIMTYSFPCTDLSVAGKMLGMKEGSGTRSSLLWEVKRLLEETDMLPQILLMENVTQVHSQENMPHFRKWLDFLENKGYVSYWQDLNAKEYGVAQNRDRTFCISILGEYNYKFPKTIPLRYIMKDYLEDEVEEKYYVNSEKANELIQNLLDNGVIGEKAQSVRAEQSRAEQSRADRWIIDTDGTLDGIYVIEEVN